MKKQAGISLSEVLISLFLSSLIMTLLTQLYLGSKTQYREAEKILAMNFDLHWVSDLLRDSIRRAGFTPCLGIDQLNLKRHGKVIHGLQIENQIIQINRMNEHFFKITNMNNLTQILLPYSTLFKENHLVLIADCEHAEIQKIYSVNQQTNGTLVTLDKPLQFNYSGTTYIGEFIEEQWFIKKNALFYRANQTEEITPLVHSLAFHNQLVHGKSFLEVSMGLAEGKIHKLMVAIRGS